LGSGNFSNDYKLIAEFWAGDGIYNTTKENTTEVTVGTIYGVLSVSLSLPSNNTIVPQNNTFTINATVTCAGSAGAECGKVSTLARYNKTASPDTAINTTSGATPFYIVGASNLQTSPSTLGYGQDWNVSWTVNATGPNYGNYLIDVLFNSSYGSVADNDTINPTVCIGACAKFWNATFNTTEKQTGQWNITTTANADWFFTHIFDDGRNFNLSSYIENTKPTIIANITSPTDVYTNTTWKLNLTVTDPDVGDIITAYTQFYVNGSEVGSVISHEVINNTNTNVANLSSSDFGKGATLIAEFWAGDGTENTTKYNTTEATVLNSPPSQVNLSYPENNDTLFINRTPMFNWTAATDADNENLTYQIQVSLNSDVSSPLTNETGISNTYYIQPSELSFTTYYWKVRANDSEEYGTWSDTWNFTLVPSVSIILRNDTINFGTMEQFEVNDTTNNKPNPFKLENDGNTEVNISVNSSSLWSSESALLNTSYYQFRADSSEELNSFNWSNSQTTWANMSDVEKSVIDTLNHSDSSDLAEIEIRVEVASDEPPGSKSTNLIFHIEGS